MEEITLKIEIDVRPIKDERRHSMDVPTYTRFGCEEFDGELFKMRDWPLCFNCSRPDHPFYECPLPKNHSMIQKNRHAMWANKGDRETPQAFLRYFSPEKPKEERKSRRDRSPYRFSDGPRRNRSRSREDRRRRDRSSSRGRSSRSDRRSRDRSGSRRRERRRSDRKRSRSRERRRERSRSTERYNREKRKRFDDHDQQVQTKKRKRERSLS